MSIDQAPMPPAIVSPAGHARESVVGRALLRAGFHPIAMRVSSIGHFQMSGTISGKAVEVLLDTGASKTVVDRGWATDAGYKLSPLKQTGGGVGGAGLDLAVVEGATLTLGDVALAGSGLLAIDLSGIQAQLRAQGAAVPQVVLGADSLRARRAVIDYATATLWLAPTPSAKPAR